MAKNPEIYCVNHPLQPLVCPICSGSAGGKRTARKHAGKHGEWGKLGGRPKKKKPQPKG